MKKSEFCHKLALYGTSYGVSKEHIKEIARSILEKTSMEDIIDIEFDENGVSVKSLASQKSCRVVFEAMDDDTLTRSIHDAFIEYAKRHHKSGASRSEIIYNLLDIATKTIIYHNSEIFGDQEE